MSFYNKFRGLCRRIVVSLFVSFCPFLVDCAWGWELFSNKPLVVYFDNFGNTQLVAESIQERLGADVIRLETVVKYPNDKELRAAQMLAEVKAKNYFPVLVDKKVDLSPYNVIVVGTPVWDGKAAPAVMSFLLKNDFTGKKVYFFSTYSEDAGIAIDEMKDACPNATYGSSLKVELKSPRNDENTVVIPNDVIKKWTAGIMTK